MMEGTGGGLIAVGMTVTETVVIRADRRVLERGGGGGGVPFFSCLPTVRAFIRGEGGGGVYFFC